MKSLRQSVARSLVWTLLESGGLSSVSLLTLIAFAWLLSPSEVGLGTIALGMVQILIVPIETLFQDALIQRSDVEEAHFDTAFTVTLALGLVMTFAGWACSGVLARFVGLPGIAPIFTLMNLSLIPMSFATVAAARQRRDLEFRSLAVRSLIGRFGGAAIGIAVALCGGGVWALAAQQLALVTLAAATLWVMAANRPRLGFSARHFRDLIGFGLRSMAVMLANIADRRVYMLLVGAWLGASSAGYMNIAFRVIDTLRDVIAGAVVQLALPLFGRFQGSAVALRSSYAEATDLTCLVGFPMFAGLSVCAPEVVSLLFGPQWEQATPYVMLFGLLTLPYFVTLYVMPCMAACGRPLAALPALLTTLTFVTVGMATVGRMSLALAAGVWAARLLVSAPIDAVLLRRVSGIPFRTQAVAAGFPLLGALAIVASVSVERLYLPSGLPVSMRLVALAGLGAVVYGGLMLLLNRPTVMRLLTFVRLAVGRSRAAGSGAAVLP